MLNHVMLCVIQISTTQQMSSEYVFLCLKSRELVEVSDKILSKLDFPVYYCRIHSWGDSLEEAYEQCAMGMFGYMTDTETVQPIDTVEVESEGERHAFKPYLHNLPEFYLNKSNLNCLVDTQNK